MSDVRFSMRNPHFFFLTSLGRKEDHGKIKSLSRNGGGRRGRGEGKKKKLRGEMWPRNYTKAPSGYMQSLHVNEGLVPVGC